MRRFATLTIKEQTHYYKDFAPEHPGYAGGLFIHNGVVLCSDGQAPLYTMDYCSLVPGGAEAIWLFVKGKADNDPVASSVPAKHWQPIKEAIEAYNEWGLTQ